MARPRGFEPTAAVEAAMRLFWRRGYDAVSFDDLVAGSRASRNGLYALWPSKRALLVDSLALYSKRVGDHFFLEMERPEAGLREVGRFFDRFEEAAREPAWRGCLIMRTSVDAIASDADVAAAIAGYLDRLTRALDHAFAGAARRGETGKRLDPVMASRQALAVVVACSTLGVLEGYSRRVSELIAGGRAAGGQSTARRR